MRLFLSHSSKDKPLIREILKQLPDFLDTWMDETNLNWGTPLAQSLESAIQVESDFVIVFVGQDAVNSDWVKQEVEWALEQEKRLGREFLLPVLIEEVEEIPEWMTKRVFRRLHDLEEKTVKSFGVQLAEDLFRLLAASWDRSHAGGSKGGITVSGSISCDRVDVIADRRRGPYGQPGWLREWQQQHLGSETEVIVIARTAKWWYDQISGGVVVPSPSLSISILASDPVVDRRFLGADDRREFADHLKIVLRNFATASRNSDHFKYFLAPALVLDSFTFIKSRTVMGNAVLILFDLYTGARYDGPRPQIVFQHKEAHKEGHDCIARKLEERARRMLASGGRAVTRREASKIADPFKQIEEEPSRRDSAGRLANYAIAAFDFYDNILNSIAEGDDIEPPPLRAPAPVCVQIEITDRCIVNRCLGCSRGLNPNPEEMSIDVFKKLVQELAQMGTKSIILSGGEPLIHPRILKFLAFASDMDMSIAVLTDGLAIAGNEELAEAIAATVSSIRISVDGFTAEHYRKIRQLKQEEGDPIDRIERGIHLLSEARQTPNSKLEHVGVCVTLFKSNVSEIESARTWVMKHESIDSLVFKFAHGTTETISHTTNPHICSVLDVKNARAAINLKLEGARPHQAGNARYVSTYIDRMGAEAISSGKPTAQVYDRGGAICFTPILFSLVDSSGGVYICCHTYYDNSGEHENRKKLLFGNVSRESFSDIWQQSAFSRVNQIHEWDRKRAALQCTCPMRDECTRHWKHNEFLTSAFAGYSEASLSGRHVIAREIRRLAESLEKTFWL